MKDIYYKSSEGVIINLIQKPYEMLDDTDLFDWKWDYVTAGSNYPYITAFTNNMIARQFNLVISGSSKTDMLNNIEHFVEVVDRDVRLNKAGKLYYGDYYREVLFTEHTKGKFLTENTSTHGFTIVAENGDWKSTQDQSYSGVSGGKYINKYCVPSVSSNENNYEYGIVEDTQGTFTFTADFSQGYNVSYYMTFTFESVSANIQYKLDNGNLVTVTPSDCPLEIDVSSANNITITPSQFLTISYSMTAEPNANYINWSTASGDETREFILDLGDITSVESVSGIGIGEAVTSLGENCYLQISSDGTNYTTVDSCLIPTDDSLNELSFEPSSPTDLRYIKIVGERYFSVKSRTFKIEAHFTGEEQNLATSATVNYSTMDQVYSINDEGLVEMYREFANSSDEMILTLPKKSTIVAINNLLLINNVGAVRFFYIDDENGNEIARARLSANTTENFSWSGEVEASELHFSFNKYCEIQSNDFQILEEQTEAPHRYILNENYVPSDAIIRIYGPTTSPSIMIGDNQYGAENITLIDGEYLEINTRDETIQHYVDSEGWANVFNHRLDDTFEKIEVGTSEITWQGNLRIDIQLLNSRSDPKWN